MSLSNARGFTLVELLVVVVFLVVGIALLTPAFGRASRQHQVEECAAHLKALHAAQQAYYVKGGPAPELGRVYWEKLAATTPPLVTSKTLVCPLAAPEVNPGSEYLGPASDPRTLSQGDPIGCDRPGNHSRHGREGGNLLLNSGAVVNDNPTDAGRESMWGDAIRKYCRP